MGKMYAVVVAVTPLENRTKKDGSGQYEYAAISIQPLDINGKPMTHERFDGFTGQSLGEMPDTILYDCVRERAKALAADNYHVGETVVVNVSMYHNQYGRNELTVLGVQRYQQQQPTPQPTNYPPYNR